MNPFDTVKVKITKNDIEYTYGGTVICTFTNEQDENIVGVSLLNSDGVVYFKESDVEAI